MTPDLSTILAGVTQQFVSLNLVELTSRRPPSLTAGVIWTFIAFTSVIASGQSATVLISIVAVSEHVPEHPANDPVLLLDSVGVSAHVVDPFGLRPCVSVDVEDLSMECRFADLRTAIRWLNGCIAPEVRRQGFRVHCHSFSTLDSFFLESLTSNLIIFALPMETYLHHCVQSFMALLAFIQRQSLEESCLRLALSQRRSWWSHTEAFRSTNRQPSKTEELKSFNDHVCRH